MFMNKKSYFLIVFLTSMSFTIFTHNNISSRVIAAQEEYIFLKLIDMRNNKQMTKENLDVLKNAMQIESFEKILVHKRELLLPTIKSHTWTAIKGLVGGLGGLISVYIAQIYVMINFNLLDIDQMPKKIHEYCLVAKEILQEQTEAKILLTLLVTCSTTISGYCLQKTYCQERDRYNTLKIIDELIKELKQLDIA